MDFLVPDEEKWFHWVLRGHLMEGDSPAAGVDDSNGPRTDRPLQKHFGFKQLDTITKKVLLKIVPTLSRSTKRGGNAPASCLDANANASLSFSCFNDETVTSSCCRHLFGEGRTGDIGELQRHDNGEEPGARGGNGTAASWIRVVMKGLIDV